METQKYNANDLYIVHKIIEGVDEIFLCKNIIDYYRDIFTTCMFDTGDYDFAEQISNYCLDNPLSNNDECDLKYWFDEYNKINKIIKQTISIESIDCLSDADIYNKWKNLELLKKYSLKRLFIIIKNNTKQNQICKYNIIEKKFIDIFSGEKFKISSNDVIICLEDYLNSANIKCDYKRLNVYSLLRLRNQIERIETNKLMYKKQLTKLP